MVLHTKFRWRLSEVEPVSIFPISHQAPALKLSGLGFHSGSSKLTCNFSGLGKNCVTLFKSLILTLYRCDIGYLACLQSFPSFDCFEFNRKTMAVPTCQKRRLNATLHLSQPNPPGTQCSLHPRELWNLKRRMTMWCVLSHLPVISLRILLTAWPRWGDPLAYGGPSWSTYSVPVLQRS